MKVEDAVIVEPVGEFELKRITRPLAAYSVVAPLASKILRRRRLACLQRNFVEGFGAGSKANGDTTQTARGIETVAASNQSASAHRAPVSEAHRMKPDCPA